MSNSCLGKASFMSWLAATIGWQKNARCVGANSKNSGLGLKNSSRWRRLVMQRFSSSGRPIFHQLEKRIEAHIFVAFLAFCLHATLRHKLRLRAPGLTPRSVLEQLSAIQMLDVHFPTTDGRWLIFCRYTSPNKLQKLLIGQLALELPAQTPPRITSRRSLEPLPSQTRL